MEGKSEAVEGCLMCHVAHPTDALTFYVLQLINPKDLSEEKQRENEFSLMGKSSN